jgi:hypothetical protein
MAQLRGPFQFISSIGNLRSYHNKGLKQYILATEGSASTMQDPSEIGTMKIVECYV